ncbi:MAG: InlB B-repeat-containing protein, partial [Christensenellales bacterium]
METKNVLSIIFSILFVGAFTFVLCWGIINFNKVKDGISGTGVYTQEDINNAYQDGYNTALEDKTEYDELINGYRDTITTLNDNISRLNSQVSTLTNKNNDCQTQITSLTNIINQNETTIRNLNDTINTNNSTIDYLTSEINILTETKTNLETQITSLNNNIANKEIIINGLNSQIIDLQNDINYKRTQIVELNNQVTALQIQLAELTSNENKNSILIENLNSQIINLNNEIDLLESSIETKTNEIQTLNNYTLQLNIEINQLKSEIVEKQASISSLENQVANLKTLNTQLEQTNESNTNTITILNNQIVNLNSQISELTLQIQNNSTSVSSLNNKIAELENSIAYYEKYIAGLENNDQVVATFEFNGSVYNIQVIPKNSFASVSDPVSDNYVTFNGWTVNGQAVDISTYAITENTKFVADITCKYDVVFVIDGSEYNRQIVIENTLASIPATPIKSGYEFDGWTLDGVNIVDVNTYLVNEHSRFIAKFTKLHIVTFVYENETISTQSIRNGNLANEVSVEDTLYKKFNGWKINGMLIDINTYKITSDTTFVADITYSYDVVYSVDNANYDTQIVVTNNYASIPSNPTKAGYEFDGWMLNNEIVNPANIRITENTIFTAKFTRLFVVAFVVEGETISSQYVRNGNMANTVNVDSTAYRVFNGWTVDNVIVNVTEYAITQDVTFVASITYKYDVTFLVDDAVYNSQIVARNEYAIIPSNPTKSGYIFDGWTINGTDLINVENYTISKNTQFIAKFTRQYTVTFKYEDNTISTQFIRSGLNADFVSVESTQYKVFNGWLLNGEIVDVPCISINSDLEFIASITYKYDVIFMIEEDIYNQQLVIKDGYAVAPTNPTLPSRDFVGWTINGTDVINLETYKITNHTTLQAKFVYWATVQFEYENEVINTQQVSINKYANDVSVESTEKKVFKGWSIDGTNVVNVAGTPIT